VTGLGNFWPIGLLLKAYYIFGKDEVAQSNGNILGHFWFKQIYYILTKIGTSKTLSVVSILKFQKWFDVDILDFRFEL
jgi:hypothetical protein